MSGIPLEPIIALVGFWFLAVNTLGIVGYLDYITEHKDEWHNVVLVLCAMFFPLNWTYIFFFLFTEFKTRQTKKNIEKDKKKKAIKECEEFLQKQPEKTREILQAKGLLSKLFRDVEVFDFTFQDIAKVLNVYERNLFVYAIKNNIDIDCDEVLNFTLDVYKIFQRYV